MKPGEHPEFFRFAPPPGTSRESTIVLDREGRFFHDGERVEHPSLDRALHSWVARHPDDKRPILTNGYDWCYFTVEDTPWLVCAVHVGPSGADIVLTDGTVEPLEPARLSLADGGVVYARVKGGAESARLTQHALSELATHVTDNDGVMELELGGVRHAIAPRAV